MKVTDDIAKIMNAIMTSKQSKTNEMMYFEVFMQPLIKENHETVCSCETPILTKINLEVRDESNCILK